FEKGWLMRRPVTCAKFAWAALLAMFSWAALAPAPCVARPLDEIFAGEAPESVDDLRAMESHIQKLADRLIPATVGVRVGGAQGSGVIINREGFVLTAAHVCGKPGRDVVFQFPDGKTAKGKTLGTNHGIDAGLMQITDKGDWPTVEMGDFETIKTGQWVLAIGHPGGYQKERGAVVRLGRVLTKRSGMLNTDCTLVGGDSGGPLFDMNGKVVGIHSRIGGSLTANIHVPIGTYHETWDRLAAAEEWGGAGSSGGPFVGVVGDPDASVAKIAEVHEGSPAAKAGIRPDDVIIEFAGKEVKDFDSLAAAVRSQTPGKKVKVKVTRDEETLELELTIGKRD
ncbi:MAG: trypsin-like peptidase domain-containing protein, partial [Planctomycetales bacterium]|nr:trypsin-like peptidase domain-containing protein [Planctomycetales bacterium]